MFKGVLNSERMPGLGIAGFLLLLLRFGRALAVAAASFLPDRAADAQAEGTILRRGASKGYRVPRQGPEGRSRELPRVPTVKVPLPSPARLSRPGEQEPVSVSRAWAESAVPRG
jgi:hypothetical protein